MDSSDTMERALMFLEGAQEELDREPHMLQAIRESLDELCADIAKISVGNRIPTKIEALQSMLGTNNGALSPHDRQMIMKIIKELSN